MTDTRQRGGQWMTNEHIDVKYADIAGLKAAISDAEARLTDCRFDYETYDDYGSPSVSIYIEGWRKATPAEIRAAKTKRAEAEAQQRSFEEQQIERLRAQRPELFK
jgi:hypothetical protein